MKYSEDFKLRVVEAIRSGNLTQSGASTVFGVTRRSIRKWLDKVEQGSSLKRSKPGRKSKSEKIASVLDMCRKELQEIFVSQLRREHPDISDEELATLQKERSVFLLWFHGEVEKVTNIELQKDFRGQNTRALPDTQQ